jgi:predicted alpha/beta hydrolase family esterase
MTGSSTYIVTLLYPGKFEIGPQHIRQNWESAISIATRISVRKLQEKSPKRWLESSKKHVQTRLEECGNFASPDGSWAVVIGQPDTEG